MKYFLYSYCCEACPRVAPTYCGYALRICKSTIYVRCTTAHLQIEDTYGVRVGKSTMRVYTGSNTGGYFLDANTDGSIFTTIRIQYRCAADEVWGERRLLPIGASPTSGVGPRPPQSVLCIYRRLRESDREAATSFLLTCGRRCLVSFTYTKVCQSLSIHPYRVVPRSRWDLSTSYSYDSAAAEPFSPQSVRP